MRTSAMMLMSFTLVAGAQVPPLAQGSRLKLELIGHQRFEGTLMAQSSDSLTVAVDGARLVRFPSSSVGRIKSTLGKSHAAGARKGVKLGTLIGAGVGVVVGLAYMTDNGSGYVQDDFNGVGVPAVFGLVGAAEGALYGVIIGAIAGAQDWKTIYDRPYSVTLGPTAGGIRLGWSRIF